MQELQNKQVRDTGKPSCTRCGGLGWVSTPCHCSGCTSEECVASCPDEEQAACWCTWEIDQLNEVYFAVEIALDKEGELKEYYLRETNAEPTQQLEQL